MFRLPVAPLKVKVTPTQDYRRLIMTGLDDDVLVTHCLKGALELGQIFRLIRLTDILINAFQPLVNMSKVG